MNMGLLKILDSVSSAFGTLLNKTFKQDITARGEGEPGGIADVYVSLIYLHLLYLLNEDVMTTLLLSSYLYKCYSLAVYLLCWIFTLLDICFAIYSISKDKSS